MSRAWQWINERWPLTALFKFGMEEDIVGGSSYAYTLGSATLVVFILQVVTGVWQMFYYVPTVDHAYNSLSYLRTQVSFGWLIHGLHYWGANAMVILVGLHMIRVFIWGAYKGPRELTWLLGIVLMLLTMAISFTGAVLPWDELGYWAVEVMTSAASTVPLIGDFIQRMLRGGEAMGQLTLTRFFMMHVAILPALLALFIGLHLVAFRQFGSVGPWKEARRQTTEPFWPTQVFKDALVGLIVFFVLITLSAYAIEAFTGPADPVDTSYLPKPEWNFLFFYQAIKYFKGPLEPVGILGLPIIGILVLVLIPFIDRGDQRNPTKRPFAMAFILFSIALFCWLSFAGYYSNPEVAGGKASVAPAIHRGADLFRSLGCVGCHKINGIGEAIGPDLSNEGGKGQSRSWLVTQIQNPKAHNPSSAMPAFPSLSKDKMAALVDFLLSLHTKAVAQPNKAFSHASVPMPSKVGHIASKVPGQAAFFIGNPSHGAILYKPTCQSCHGPRGTDRVPNPGSSSGMVPPLNPVSKNLFSEDAQTFATNLDIPIQHGSTPAGPSPALKMPDFGASNTLTQPEIANIEAYIMALNGVSRAQLVNPGMQPETFFVLTAAVVATLALGLGIIRWLMFTRQR